MRSKRLCSLALSSLLAFSMSAPAFAAEIPMGEENLAPVSTTGQATNKGTTPANAPESSQELEADNAPVANGGATQNAVSQETATQSGELGAQAEGTDINSATVDPISVRTYTGSPIKPVPVVKYEGATLKEGTDYTVSYSNNVNETKEALVIITGTGSFYGSKTVKFEITGKGCGVTYQTHVQDVGWQGFKSNGTMSGTEGQAKRLEGIQLMLMDAPLSGGIEYRTHVQNSGWEKKWATNGATAGTTGRALRLEAIQIRLTGNMANAYNVWYRTHVQDEGWQTWKKNGDTSGTEGKARRLEAIEVLVLPNTAPAPGDTDDPFKFAVTYRTHVQDIGWQAFVADGAKSGTEGQAKRLEAIEVKLSNSPYTGQIQYKTHIQDVGWESSWVANGNQSGTTGKAKRLEAIQIRLTDELADKYDIYYSAHAQDVGWMGWAKNGEPAGTEGYARRLESIKIQLVSKGGDAPGSTANAFMKK